MNLLRISACVALAATGANCVAAPSFLTNVANANDKVAGFARSTILSKELIQTAVAEGKDKLENPQDWALYYGYDNDGPMVPAATPPATGQAEATKTEPDKNTYLILPGQHGADAAYNYGTHFLYQGHESGVANANAQGGEAGYITRINLDADGTHRVTLLATKDVDGKPLPDFDGSTWYPFSQRLLFTAELGTSGGVWQATANYPSSVTDISGEMGRGGYEGIQADADGNLIIVEDVGGKTGSASCVVPGASAAGCTHARQANSFVYKFVPYNVLDLTLGSKLYALQVMKLDNSGPIVFGGNSSATQIDADIVKQDMKDLHTYGNTFNTSWVLLHDTNVDGITPFDANALAKLKQATPFKRPENGQFQPRTNFGVFFFDETGDTSALTEASDFGGFGSIMKLDLAKNKLSLFYKCDVAHSGFDNVAFWDATHVVFVEDAGDTLHTQRNALDSAYLFDTLTDYSSGAQPVRVMAEGRDPSATIDSANGYPYNDGDNEITGIHISDGDPTVRGLLGAKVLRFVGEGRYGVRVFYTAQHGDNITWEILPKAALFQDR